MERASSGCGSRVTSPACSSAVTIRVIVGRADLLGLGEPPDRQRAAEHDHARAPRAAPAGAPPRRPRGARRAAGGSPPSEACRRARNSIALLPILDGPRRPSPRTTSRHPARAAGLANARDEHGVSALLLRSTTGGPTRATRCSRPVPRSARWRRRRSATSTKLEPGRPRRRRLHAAAPGRVLRRRGSRAGAARHGREPGRRRREHVRRAPDPLRVRGRRPRQRARAARGRREPERPPAGRLHAAAHRRAQRRRELARLLLDHGADPDLAADDGKTPRDMAGRRCSAREVDLAVRPRAGLRAVDEVQPLDRGPAQPRRRASAARSPSAGRAGPAWRRARTRPSPPSRRRSSRRSPPGRAVRSVACSTRSA